MLLAFLAMDAMLLTWAAGVFHFYKFPRISEHDDFVFFSAPPPGPSILPHLLDTSSHNPFRSVVLIPCPTSSFWHLSVLFSFSLKSKTSSSPKRYFLRIGTMGHLPRLFSRAQLFLSSHSFYAILTKMFGSSKYEQQRLPTPFPRMQRRERERSQTRSWTSPSFIASYQGPKGEYKTAQIWKPSLWTRVLPLNCLIDKPRKLRRAFLAFMIGELDLRIISTWTTIRLRVSFWLMLSLLSMQFPLILGLYLGFLHNINTNDPFPIRLQSPNLFVSSLQKNK